MGGGWGGCVVGGFFDVGAAGGVLVAGCWWLVGRWVGVGRVGFVGVKYGKKQCFHTVHVCAEGRLSKVTRGGTRTRNLLLRRKAPYPSGHTSRYFEELLHSWANWPGPAVAGLGRGCGCGCGWFHCGCACGCCLSLVGLSDKLLSALSSGAHAQ